MTPEKLELLRQIQSLFEGWNVGDRGYSELGFNCFVYKIAQNGTVMFIDDDGDLTNAKPYHYPYPHQRGLQND